MAFAAPLLAVLVMVTGCASQSSGDDLYRELGGTEGITNIADNFLYHIGEDDRVIGFFAESDVERFHSKMIEHICDVSGGPCEYQGDPMREVHAGMDIRETHFNAIVEDLIKAMEDEHVPTRAQNRLLNRFAAMHGEITGR